MTGKIKYLLLKGGPGSGRKKEEYNSDDYDDDNNERNEDGGFFGANKKEKFVKKEKAKFGDFMRDVKDGEYEPLYFTKMNNNRGAFQVKRDDDSWTIVVSNIPDDYKW